MQGAPKDDDEAAANESSGRQVRFRWSARRLDAALRIAGAGAVVLLVAVVVFIARNADPAEPLIREDPYCWSAQPAAPNFEIPPFDFDPGAQAQAFATVITENDSRAGYSMLAPEFLPTESLCEYPLEALWRQQVFGLDPNDFLIDSRVQVDSTASLVFSPLTDEISVWLRVVPAPREDRPWAEAPVRISLVRDGRVVRFEPDQPGRELGPLPRILPPPYADLTAFEEAAVTLGEAPWQVGGTLSVPKGPGPYPAVVLVQGESLRPDRDGTFAGTKANRDLAWGLASRGIATLRYDQRTWTHALAFARQDEFTIDDAYVHDALAAVQALRQTPRIDPARIYVLGVSFGGLAAPRIAQQAPDLAGVIVASAPSGSYLESRIRALERDFRILEPENPSRPVMQHIIDRERAKLADLEALASGQAVTPDMSVRPSYYFDLATYRPEEAAHGLDMPLLILHSNEDRRLTRDDATGWIRGLQGHPDVVFRLYPGLSHGLVDQTKLTGPELRPHGHVGAELIDDIAAWIGGARPELPCIGTPGWRAGCRGGMAPSAAFGREVMQPRRTGPRVPSPGQRRRHRLP